MWTEWPKHENRIQRLPVPEQENIEILVRPKEGVYIVFYGNKETYYYGPMLHTKYEKKLDEMILKLSQL